MSGRSHRGFAQIWRWPAALALLTVFGLVSALIGHGGIWWVLSWTALALPLVVAAVCVRRRRRAA
ncbi:MAG: hypothetical protein JWQ94_2237 [Tardiphaga sp.]|jgi:hypothetical protein|nr:hypothetical protein [Tardiphaga sp.]